MSRRRASSTYMRCLANLSPENRAACGLSNRTKKEKQGKHLRISLEHLIEKHCNAQNHRHANSKIRSKIREQYEISSKTAVALFRVSNNFYHLTTNCIY